MARSNAGLNGWYSVLPQYVYVSCPKRIRFASETYTFSTQNVYVSSAQRISRAHTAYTFRLRYGFYTSLLSLTNLPNETIAQAHLFTACAMLSWCTVQWSPIVVYESTTISYYYEPVVLRALTNTGRATDLILGCCSAYG